MANITTVNTDDILDVVIKYLDGPSTRTLMTQNADAWSTVDLTVSDDASFDCMMVTVNIPCDAEVRWRQLRPHEYAARPYDDLTSDQRDRYELPWYSFAGSPEYADVWAEALRQRLRARLNVKVSSDWDYDGGIQRMGYVIHAVAAERFFDARGYSTYEVPESKYWYANYLSDCWQTFNILQVEDEEDASDDE